MPASSAAAAVNGFSVEPGSKRSVTARLRMRRGSSLPRLFGLYAAGSPAPGSRRSARRAPRCRPPCARCSRHRGLQLAEGEVLHARVDREREVAPCCGARMLSTSSTMWPRRSLITRRLPGLPASSARTRARAFLALVVDVGEADEVRHHFAGRVVAAVLALQEHPGMPARRPSRPARAGAGA